MIDRVTVARLAGLFGLSFLWVTGVAFSGDEIDEDYHFEFSSVEALPGDEVVVTFTFTNDGETVQGIQGGVCHDDELATIEEEDLELIGDFDGSFVVVYAIGDEETEKGDGWIFATVCGTLSCPTIETGEYEVVEATYQVDEELDPEDDGLDILLEWCNVLANPAVETVVVVNGEAVTPSTTDGSIFIRRIDYIRGDCNDDGEVDLTDAIEIIEIYFGDLDPSPCESACDASGDLLPTVLDPLVILLYLFEDSLPPPEPFPDCGRSDDFDDCEGHTSCE